MKTARARESVIKEMIRHAVTILRVAMDTTDDKTKHLTDHIYHMITFAAVIICRLLNMFERQVACYNNVEDLDGLVQEVIVWMQSVGLRCHAAYMLGNAVAKVQRKLRPNLHHQQRQQQLHLRSQEQAQTNPLLLFNNNNNDDDRNANNPHFTAQTATATVPGTTTATATTTIPSNQEREYNQANENQNSVEQNNNTTANWLTGAFPNYFPEFLGVEVTGNGNWDLLNSWPNIATAAAMI